jgi:Double-GTPase 2
MSSETPQPPTEAEPGVAPEAVDDGETTLTESEVPNWVELPDGAALDEAQADEILKITPGRIVLLAGEDATGKTTLSCGIYEQYLKGEFAGQFFAGSRTLRAFEQRIFFQRAESQRPVPTMERTRLVPGQTELLHLDLQSKSSGERVALMLSDLAGEAFNLIRNDPAECERYPVLRRVDCVTMLLDGERLMDSEERHGHVNSTRTTLRSILQSAVVRPGVPVIVVISKWDLLTGEEEKENAREDAEKVLATVEGMAREHPTEIVRVAAAPPTEGSVKAGHGLVKLITTWLAIRIEEDAGGWVSDGEDQSESAFDSYRDQESDDG